MSGVPSLWNEWSAKFMARADMLGYLQVLIKDGVALPDIKEELSEEAEYYRECNKMAYNQLILCC